jgi:hypothetical protein
MGGLLGVGLSDTSAQSVKIHNYHAKENDKADLNQSYINRKIEKMVTLDSTCFVDGYVIKGHDTVECDIYMPKHKIPDDIFLYAIVRGGDGEISAYTARDIDAYGFNGIKMWSHRSEGSSFFIREIQTGRVTLYTRESVPGDQEFTYYLQRHGDSSLLAYMPNKRSFIYIQERYNSGGMASPYSGRNDDQLRAAFAEYFKDCEPVRNKLMAKFYGPGDLETMVREYNLCDK